MQLASLVLVLFGVVSHCMATLDKIADIIHDVVHNPSHPVDHRQPYYPQAEPYVQNYVHNRPYVVVTGHQQNRPQSRDSYNPQTVVYYPHRIQNAPNSYRSGSDNSYSANVYGRQDGYYEGQRPTYRQNGNGHNYDNDGGYQTHPHQYRQRNVGTGLNGNGYNYPPAPVQRRHGNAAISLNVVI